MIAPRVATNILPLLPSLFLIFNRALDFQNSHHKMAREVKPLSQFFSPVSPSSPNQIGSPQIASIQPSQNAPPGVLNTSETAEQAASQGNAAPDPNRAQSPITSPHSSRPTSPGAEEILGRSIKLLNKYQEQQFEKLGTLADFHVFFHQPSVHFNVLSFPPS